MPDEKTELQDKVIRYQRDCYRVLWNAFNPQSPPTPDTEQSQAITVLEQIRATALAVAQWAEQQMPEDVVQRQNSIISKIIEMRLATTVTVDQSQLTEDPLPF